MPNIKLKKASQLSLEDKWREGEVGRGDQTHEKRERLFNKRKLQAVDGEFDVEAANNVKRAGRLWQCFENSKRSHILRERKCNQLK